MKICENRGENLVSEYKILRIALEVFPKKLDENLQKICEWSGAKDYQSGRSPQELSNEYLVAKITFDTAENEPLKVWITDHNFDHIPSLGFSSASQTFVFLSRRFFE